jgi:flagellar basal body-associated protein FliL
MFSKSVNFYNTTRRHVPEGDNFTVTDVELQTSQLCSVVVMNGILAQETGLFQNNQGNTNLLYATIGMSNRDANIRQSVLRKRKHLVRNFITHA